jgi:hypothetical protein
LSFGGSRRETMSDLVTAWRTNEPWREDFVFWATRELSKTGDLGAYAHCMRELATGLRTDEVLWLYAQLQKSYRLTCEWQAEFLDLFPQVSRDDLPPPIFDEDAAIRFAEEARAKAERERAEYEWLHGPYPGPDDPIPF